MTKLRRLKAGSATYLATLAQASNYTFETFIIEINVAKIYVVVSFNNEFTFNGNEIILSPQYSILDGDFLKSTVLNLIKNKKNSA